jgi:hypothetical protein
MTKKLALGAVLLAASSLLVGPAQAGGVKVGVLTCAVEPGWGKVIVSSKELNCNYVPNGGRGEPYFGAITKVGVDIGYTSGGTMIWNVIAPTSDLGPGALEGKYAGATAQATVGIGLGANVLLGGFDKSIALQPVSIEGTTGLNIAAGVGAINLRHG